MSLNGEIIIEEKTVKVHPYIAESARLNLPDLPDDATPEQIEQRERLIEEREREFAKLSRNIAAGDISEQQFMDKNSGVWTAELLNAFHPETSQYDIANNFQEFAKQIWAMLMPLIAHNGHAIGADLQRELDMAKMYRPKEGSKIYTGTSKLAEASYDVHEQFAKNAAHVTNTDATLSQTVVPAVNRTS